MVDDAVERVLWMYWLTHGRQPLSTTQKMMAVGILIGGAYFVFRLIRVPDQRIQYVNRVDCSTSVMVTNVCVQLGNGGPEN